MKTVDMAKYTMTLSFTIDAGNALIASDYAQTLAKNACEYAKNEGGEITVDVISVREPFNQK